ncbi:MAG: DUF1501 domain-containing protein [Pseudomonadota bacterium]
MTRRTVLNRRRFLTALGASAAALPLVSLPGFVRAAGKTPGQGSGAGNILVLIELAGGNDGLNTVIPTRDPAYRGLRPTIGLLRSETLTLDRDTGLHPAMGAVADIWDRGDLRIVEGVGYPNPNRSHFRSIEIWNAGQGADSSERTGWVPKAFGSNTPGARHAEGMALGGSMGPLYGPGRYSSMQDEDTLRETLDALQTGGHPVRPNSGSPLDHVLSTYDRARITGDAISKRLEASAARGLAFPESDLGQQLRTAARLLDAGVEVSVLKVVQDGYDTHDAQPILHTQLLRDLSEAIGAFERALKQIGLWDQVTIVTYSEFGRTARENGSDGTDHGTAAPVFVAGGSVAGGFDGARVSLDRLVDDDLVHTTDYRTLYAGLLGGLWGIDAPAFNVAGAKALRLFG